jgi:prepilin-type N-terminal cleavage/methylation domain-containing protein
VRRGFTLIEMLVSISIGASICATAFVGVRVVSQSVAMGGRLSVENQLLRAGVQAALDDLDTWKSYDDQPNGDTPLRGDAQPFKPLGQGSLALAEDFNFDYMPVRDPTQSYDQWWRRDARTWFRSDPNIGSSYADAYAMGDYGLFGWDRYADTTVFGGAEKRWRHRLVKEVNQHLGFLAMIDYAPANLLYSYLERQDTWKDKKGWIAGTGWECVAGGSGGIGTMVSNAWAEDKPHDFVCLLTGTFFTIVVPSRQTDPRYKDPAVNRAMFQSWWNFYETGRTGPNSGWGGNDGYTVGGTKLTMLPLRPATWSDVAVRVRHYAANARQFHSATIMSQSPVTGQVFKLFFTFTGTTLRGARIQRQLDGTWGGP